MAQIRRIKVVQSSKTLALVYFVFGVIAAVIMALVSLAAGGGVAQALSMVLLFSVVYAVAAFIGFTLFAMIYNFVAARWGGIEVETM